MLPRLSKPSRFHSVVKEEEEEGEEELEEETYDDGATMSLMRRVMFLPLLEEA